MNKIKLFYPLKFNPEMLKTVFQFIATTEKDNNDDHKQFNRVTFIKVSKTIILC